MSSYKLLIDKNEDSSAAHTTDDEQFSYFQNDRRMRSQINPTHNRYDDYSDDKAGNKNHNANNSNGYHDDDDDEDDDNIYHQVDLKQRVPHSHSQDLIQYDDNADDSLPVNSQYNRMPKKIIKNYNFIKPANNNIIIMNNDSRGGGTSSNINNSKCINSTSINNLLAASDVDVDEGIMEIPLLLGNTHKGSENFSSCDNERNNNYTSNPNNLKHACLCQQKGFTFNLNNNSTKTAKTKILWAIVLCCIFMIIEFLGGYIAGSLAIMTDAAHLASDCISFVIGLVAIWLGNKPPDGKMSFGYKRMEVMGAIISILGIWILTATLVLVAIQRIYANDYDLDVNTMMIISGIGILINIIMIFILHTSTLNLPEGSIGNAHGHSHSHNHSHRHRHEHHHHSPYRGQKHWHSSSARREQTAEERGHQYHLARDNHHLHQNDADNSNVHCTEFSSRSISLAGEDDVCAVSAAAAAVDTAETTSIELSSAPLACNGNGSKHHEQDGNEHNLNLRAAMIHVIGDLVQSVGVFISSILIKVYPKAVVLDPLCTLLFSVIVFMTTVNLFKESMHIIMDTVPRHISVDDLEMDLLNINGVKSVHHLNVWNHTSGHSILMVHLVIDFLSDSNTVLNQVTKMAEGPSYSIKHCTIQIERMTS